MFAAAEQVAPPGAAGLFHTTFLYRSRADLAVALLRLQALGVPIHGASDHLVSEAIYFEDPDGNGIEIYADRPEDQWRVNGREIEMATLRLDLDDLLGAAPEDTRRAIAGAHPSTAAADLPSALAAPTGTTVGHVHLRAADLPESNEFWSRTVGLDITNRYGDVATFLSAGGYHHHIGVNRFARWSAPVEGGAGLAEMDIARVSRSAPAETSHDAPRVFTTPEDIRLALL